VSIYSELKQQCLEANVQLPQKKLVDLSFGNVSVIDHSLGVFAIKPSGVHYAKLISEEIVIVDLDGNVREGTMQPSSDTPTHRRLYQAFSDIKSVVHTHSRTASAFAQAGRGIPCLGTTHADYFLGQIPVTRPMTSKEIEGPYEWETGNVIVERFLELDSTTMPAVLVHGHGSFVWGPSAAKAMENALALEVVAEMAWKAMSLNPNVQPISEHLMKRHFFRKHGSGSDYGQKRSPETNM
jgi:L-ribulose-5-phosphate 4-epimerase